MENGGHEKRAVFLSGKEPEELRVVSILSAH